MRSGAEGTARNVFFAGLLPVFWVYRDARWLTCPSGGAGACVMAPFKLTVALGGKRQTHPIPLGTQARIFVLNLHR